MVLKILLGIIIFFVIILSIPLHISFSYEDKLNLTVRYLFIKFRILPLSQKKPKKEKEKKPKPEKKAKEEKPSKEKKPNPIIGMLKANGHDGMMEVLSNMGHVFGLYSGKLLKSVKFDEIDIYIVVGKGDAAQTAIEYGKTCQKIYPMVSFLCTNNVVSKYDVSVEPDFLANKTQGEFFIDFHFIIRKIINASIGMVFRLLFEVVLKFITNAKKGTKKNEKTNEADPREQAVK